VSFCDSTHSDLTNREFGKKCHLTNRIFWKTVDSINHDLVNVQSTNQAQFKKESHFLHAFRWCAQVGTFRTDIRCLIMDYISYPNKIRRETELSISGGASLSCMNFILILVQRPIWQRNRIVCRVAHASRRQSYNKRGLPTKKFHCMRWHGKVGQGHSTENYNQRLTIQYPAMSVIFRPGLVPNKNATSVRIIIKQTGIFAWLKIPNFHQCLSKKGTFS